MRLLILLGALLSLPAAAAPPILRLADVHAGMTGIGRTVFRGTAVEPFDFEVLDVLEGEGYAPNLILIKVGGEAIEAAGGIAAGMSGSPLYIDDQLIGAVAFTTAFADTRYGYATPIEDMLKLFDLPPPATQVARGSVLDRLPAGTPILARGLRGRALERVADLMRRHGHRAVQGDAPQPAGPVAPEVVPVADALSEGSAVAASLTTGDIVLTALGTVTYRDGNRLLAFGHPFMQRGRTSLFMHPAYIYGVVPALDVPFKIGAPAGEAVGAFVQDRAAGIAGQMQAPVEAFDLTLDVRDESLERRRILKVQVVRDQELAPTLVAVALLQTMDEVMDRVGGGTASMQWRVEAEGLPEPLQRHDRVFSASDVVSAAIPGPLFTLDALLRNDFSAVRPERLRVEVVVTPERRTARLVALKLARSEVKAGETVEATVTLQPYRGEPVQRAVTLQVPGDTPVGPLVLSIHGREDGARGPLSQAALLASGLRPPQSLAELLSALATAQRGDALTAQLLTLEAEAARREALDRLVALPSADLFSEEVSSLPPLDVDPAVGLAQPVAQAQELVDWVVQGRLRQPVTVVR